jgi:hypothetical protein
MQDFKLSRRWGSMPWSSDLCTWHDNPEDHDLSVVVTRLGMRGATSQLPYSVLMAWCLVKETGSMAHPASYLMGTGGETDHSPWSSAEVKNVRSCISTAHTSSWRSTLSTGTLPFLAVTMFYVVHKNERNKIQWPQNVSVSYWKAQHCSFHHGSCSTRSNEIKTKSANIWLDNKASLFWLRLWLKCDEV